MKCDGDFPYLPREIVKRDDRTGNIQRGVENIREVICEGIHLKRMSTAGPLLVGHGFLVHLICLSERMVYLRRIRTTSF
jgi:hypothetical protein